MWLKFDQKDSIWFDIQIRHTHLVVLLVFNLLQFCVKYLKNIRVRLIKQTSTISWTILLSDHISNSCCERKWIKIFHRMKVLWLQSFEIPIGKIYPTNKSNVTNLLQIKRFSIVLNGNGKQKRSDSNNEYRITDIYFHCKFIEFLSLFFCVKVLNKKKKESSGLNYFNNQKNRYSLLKKKKKIHGHFLIDSGPLDSCPFHSTFFSK